MSSGLEDRTYWLEILQRISEPVLVSLSEQRLKESMPVEGTGEERDRFSHLEALGRLLAGISYWLEHGPNSGDEGRSRNRYAKLARAAIDSGTNPDSPDYMNFEYEHQPIVDAAFLAQAILRAPTELWEKLDGQVQTNVIRALMATRKKKPHFNNWLLFSAMIESALCKMGEEWDPMRIDYALKQHKQWYLGDGTYGDGPEFHWDYYNSFVIHPMLVDIIKNMADQYNDWDQETELIIKRAQRYAAIQERLISPEGTFPAVGRSLAYRFGAFHLLAQMSCKHMLPSGVTPAQVRCALTAVIRNMIEVPDTFDDHGWLRIGFCGSQPEIGEGYISTGSLYLCSVVFLPLGLSSADPFWKDEETQWTSQKAWSGATVSIDRALR